MLTLTYSEKEISRVSLAVEIVDINKFFDDCLMYLILQDSPDEIDLPCHNELSSEVNNLLLSEIQGVGTELRYMAPRRVAKFVDSIHWVIIDNFPNHFPISLNTNGDYIVVNLEELKTQC